MEKIKACNSAELAIRKYAQQVQNLAFVYLKNQYDAEDIAQEVFLTYLQKAPLFFSAQKEKSWLLTVTANKSKNLLKAKYREELPLTEDLSYLPNEENIVVKAVMALEEKYRVPIHLHYYEGYSLTEIAKLMKVRPGTVGSWLSRARAQLREELEEDYFET